MTDASTSISNATTACRQAFRAATRTPGLMKDEWAENRMADFNLWAAGAGALTTGKASLDHRLKTDPQTHRIVTNLVLILEALVEDCITNVTPSQDGTVTPSHDEIPPRNQGDLMREVEQSLSQLVRVTVAIRKAGTQSRLQKADRSFNPRHPQILALRVHLMTILLAQPEQDGDAGSCIETLKRARMSDTALDPIQLRLIDANLRRRGRFIYAQKHAQKVALGLHLSDSIPAPQSAKEKHQGARSHASLTPGNPKMVAPKPNNDEATQSTTTATAVDTPVEHAHKQEVKAATTAPSATSSKIHYPRPPPVSDSQTVFVCPCCCQSMPVTVGRGDKWKKHLRANILPYACILSGCPRPEVLYMTREAWTSHMEKEHESTFEWVCHLCRHKDIDSVFRDRSAFRAHLEGEHDRDIKPHRIEMLLTAWRRKILLKLTHCPLCSFRSEDHSVVLNHSAEHVHSFSLRSLPWGPTDILEDEESGDDDGNYFNEYPYFDIGGSCSNSSLNAPGSRSSDVESQELPDLNFVQPKNVPLDEETQLTASSVEQVTSSVSGAEITAGWLATLDLNIPSTDQNVSREDTADISPEITAQAPEDNGNEISAKSRQLRHEDYTVGWICALSTELAAATAMLDEAHPVPPVQPEDTNSYVCGRIGDHNVVIACLPAGTYGSSAVVTVATGTLRSFPALKFILTVGTGGGAPYYGSQLDDAYGSENEEESVNNIRDIRLGDVVISHDVVQYSSGKLLHGKKFVPSGGKLNKLPPVVLSAVSRLQAQHYIKGTRILEILEEALKRHPGMDNSFGYPVSTEDRLFKSGTTHIGGGDSCKPCCGPNNINLVTRPDRPTTSPIVHYGTIGSANQIMKDAVVRDQLAEKENIICFDMEAAGLRGSYPCLVIRGISDYADSHRNKAWQSYAAATASSCAKELLLLIPGMNAASLTPAKQTSSQLAGTEEGMTEIKQDPFFSPQEESRQEVLSSLSTLDYNTRHIDIFAQRTEGTGTWLLETPSFVTWRDNPGKTLYCPGIPGVGKTVLASVVIDHFRAKFLDSDAALAFIYCTYTDPKDAGDLVRSLFKQIASQVPILYDLPKARNDVIQTLRSITSIFSRVYVVIDALDECSDDDRTDLIDALNRLRPFMNILVTARPVASIEQSLHWDFEQRIEAIDKDIATYVEVELTGERFPDELIRRPELRSNIVRQVVASAKGVFWNAEFQVNLLARTHSIRDLIETSENLPEPPGPL